MDAILAGLLHGCAATPDDSTPFLILADWLEDHGAGERAELVRVQCRLADWVPDREERQDLIRQQDRLLAAHRSVWIGPLERLCERIEFVRGVCRISVTGQTFGSVRFGVVFRAVCDTALIVQVKLTRCKGLKVVASRSWLASIPAVSLAGLELSGEALEAFLHSPHLEHLVDLDLTGNSEVALHPENLVESRVYSRLTRLALRSAHLPPGRRDELLDRAGPDLQVLDLGGLVSDAVTVARRALFLPPGCVQNSLGMEFVRVPAGSFLMGAAPDEPGAHEDEQPRHPVTLTRPFWLGRFTVTQEQYSAITGTAPAQFSGLFRPVERVSFSEAEEFCRQLAERPEEQAAGHRYRLPTEAEWEHACRAGTFTAFHTGAHHTHELMNCQMRFDLTVAERVLLGRTADVGSYPPNAFGLYEMHGNVWEWCADRYHAETYRRGAVVDPLGPEQGERRTCRGGCWEAIGSYCRAAKRHGPAAYDASRYRGFRVVLVTEE